MKAPLRGRAFWIIIVALLWFVASPSAAPAATFMHYGPPNTPAGWLPGHTASGGKGTLPNDYPAPTPWNMAAGDYCTAYKFAQPGAPTASAPLATVSDTNLGALTGFDPGLPREQYQTAPQRPGRLVRLPGQGHDVGLLDERRHRQQLLLELVRRAPRLVDRPGDRHAPVVQRLRRKRQARHERLPARADVRRQSRLVVPVRDAARHDDVAAPGVLLPRVALVERRRLRHADHLQGPVHRDVGAGFTAVVSDLVAAGTRYAQNWGGAFTVLGTQPSGNAYTGAITRTHLVNAIADANAIDQVRQPRDLPRPADRRQVLLGRSRQVRPVRRGGRVGDARQRHVAAWAATPTGCSVYTDY